jgi:multiple sugar transport system permease protein
VSAAERRLGLSQRPPSRGPLRWRRAAPTARSSPLGRQEARAGRLFVAPVTIGFIVFIAGPMLATIALSLTNYSMFKPPSFVGLDNFDRLLHDRRLLTVYANTALFTVLAVAGNVGLGLLIALFLDRRMPNWLRHLMRTFYFFPALVGLVYISLIWEFFFQRDTGVLNYYSNLLGGPSIPWLTSSTWAIPAVVIMDVWKNVGFAALILLAGLQGINRELGEAAAVDGANAWQQFRHITLPQISPTLFFVLTLQMIGAMKIFDSIVVLTNGGPGDASRSIVMYIYEMAFGSYKMGYASAISITLLVVVAIATALQFIVARRWVHYE